MVPDVETKASARKAASVLIDRSERVLQALDGEGRVLAQFPISLGGPRDPLPAGLVWFGLTKPHYGIHGTPEPSKIGRIETHGCVHLTNWDALELSAMASAGITLTVKD